MATAEDADEAEFRRLRESRARREKQHAAGAAAGGDESGGREHPASPLKPRTPGRAGSWAAAARVAWRPTLRARRRRARWTVCVGRRHPGDAPRGAGAGEHARAVRRAAAGGGGRRRRARARGREGLHAVQQQVRGRACVRARPRRHTRGGMARSDEEEGGEGAVAARAAPAPLDADARTVVAVAPPVRIFGDDAPHPKSVFQGYTWFEGVRLARGVARGGRVRGLPWARRMRLPC